jgi:signal peptidase I
MDYTTILLELTAVFAAIWGFDRLFLRRRRKRRAEARGADVRDPWPVDWAGSLLPVLLLVLVVRAAVAEPYRIPSGSMMPTLDVGDFIFVSKFSYGVRLPAVDTKIMDTGEPQRGDVVVFRPPWAPGESWIKRVVGLPGDRVVVRGEKVFINGEPLTAESVGSYEGDPGDDEDAYLMHYDASILEERLGDVDHQIIEMPSVNRSPAGAPDVPNADNPEVVPDGCYFVMGDNRDNSEDSRYHGCVPEEALVGKAQFIWMSLASLKRIGTAIR